jgi:hypothetical protein
MQMRRSANISRYIYRPELPAQVEFFGIAPFSSTKFRMATNCDGGIVWEEEWVEKQISPLRCSR